MKKNFPKKYVQKGNPKEVELVYIRLGAAEMCSLIHMLIHSKCT